MNLANTTIRIAIHYSCSKQAIQETIRALFETLSVDFEIIILADPIDSNNADFYEQIEPLKGIEIKEVGQPHGGAASFNQMISDNRDLYVMIEAGAIPSHGWFEQMASALYASPDHAIAGPSTNQCWNYQNISSDSNGNALEDRQSDEALCQQFRGQYLTAGPMHNLADFCIMVRGELAAKIGAADTGYGSGPCWEIDYNTRVSKCGYKSIWVQSAYVWRDETSDSKIRNNEKLLVQNKHYYQTRFCKKHHKDSSMDVPFCNHCLGDSCPDFNHSPPIIKINYNDKSPQKTASALTKISCVMPTRNRAHFVAQSIHYFNQQSYQNTELVIVYEDDNDLPQNICWNKLHSIILIKTSRESIGAKREIGTKAASGDIIAHWDDDDWYSPHRLSRQILPILNNVADITGLSDVSFMMLDEEKFWSVSADLFGQLFLENITGGSLMFRKSIWEKSGPYPDISLREDIAILIKSMRSGARLCRLPGRELSIYVRHKNNSWGFKEGTYLQPSGWQQIPMPDFLGEDASFYFKPVRGGSSQISPSYNNHRGKKKSQQLSSASSDDNMPLISCIMPTYNRRSFIETAIGHFLKQDYQNRELIIIDDGTDSISDLIPSFPMIHYLRFNSKKSLGEKRNIACRMANGEIIAHWDDDDWMATDWLSSQLECLNENDADICGLSEMLFYAPQSRKAWKYIYSGSQPWVGGGSLFYKKAHWENNNFPEINIGEDNIFVWNQAHKYIAINPRNDLYIATIHSENTSPKLTQGRCWHPHSYEHIVSILGSETQDSLAPQAQLVGA